MSDKFKKHIIDNLQPPFFYNLKNKYGISYNEENYKYFICKYFNLTPKDYKIKLISDEGNDDYIEYSFTRYRDIDEGEMMMIYVEIYVKEYSQTHYQMFWNNHDGVSIYQKTETLNRDGDIPWLSK